MTHEELTQAYEEYRAVVERPSRTQAEFDEAWAKWRKTASAYDAEHGTHH